MQQKGWGHGFLPRPHLSNPRPYGQDVNLKDLQVHRQVALAGVGQHGHDSLAGKLWTLGNRKRGERGRTGRDTHEHAGLLRK